MTVAAAPSGDVDVGNTTSNPAATPIPSTPFGLPVWLVWLGAGVVAALPALATLFGILFDWFPGLKPDPPPTQRSVLVGQVALVERNVIGDDGQVGNLFFAVVEATGYDANRIRYRTVSLDAATHGAFPEAAAPSGEIDFNTRTDRFVLPLTVPLPRKNPGCMILRVVLYPDAGSHEETTYFLDYSDSPSFDPYAADNVDCPDEGLAESPGDGTPAP